MAGERDRQSVDSIGINTGVDLTRRKFLWATAVAGGLILVGCRPQREVDDAFVGLVVEGDTPEERALNAFRALMERGDISEGDTFTVLLPGGSQSNLLPAFEEFEELTGIRIDSAEVGDLGEIHTRIMTEATARTGEPDMVLHMANWMGDFAEGGFSHELGPWIDEFDPIIDDPQIGYVPPLDGYLTEYAGRRWALGADNDAFTYFYRLDLFNDPQEQAAFEDAYGYPLGIPETWEQFDEIAEFFDRPDEGYRGAFLFANRTFAYVNWAARFVSRGGIYMDRDMEPQLLNDAGVTALEEMHRLTQAHMPPEAVTGDWAALYAAYPEGRVVQATSWISLGQFANDPATGTVIAGDVGGGLIPGSVLNGRVVHASPHVVGWVLGISRHGKNPLAMYLLAQWVTGPSKGSEVALRTGIVDPWRLHDYDDPEMIAAYGEELLPALLQNAEVAFPDIGLRGGAEYLDVMNEHLQAAMAGREDPETALGNIERAWVNITDRLGHETQTEAWRAELANYPQHLHDLWEELGHNV
jgi:multiple sugar transport system substrate-binding protein